MAHESEALEAAESPRLEEIDRLATEQATERRARFRSLEASDDSAATEPLRLALEQALSDERVRFVGVKVRLSGSRLQVAITLPKKTLENFVPRSFADEPERSARDIAAQVAEAVAAQ